MYADVQALLEGDPDTREARKVEWIGALRTLGLTASVSEDAIEIDFDLRTDSDGLTEEDLPIASGSESPDIVKRSGEIGVGIRNIAQTVKFVEAAAQAIDPSGYGDGVAVKRTIEKRLGVDIDADLIDQPNGDLSATISSMATSASVPSSTTRRPSSAPWPRSPRCRRWPRAPDWTT